MTTLTIKRVGENKYISYLTGCVVGRYYDMQLKFAPPVIGPWEYAGQFVAVDGTITTWEWSIPNPNSEYPYQFRFIDKVTGTISNVVTIDPLNPPPINGEVEPPINGVTGAGFGVLPLIILAIIAVVIFFGFVGKSKGGKK